jgi:hypothetical protein
MIVNNISGKLHLFDNTLSGITVSGGLVGIGTVTPSEKLHVVGNICYTGSIGACSDMRYKKNIVLLSNSLSKVLKIQGVNYDWKTTEFPEKQFVNTQQIGFIAQDMEKIYPEMVITDKEGYKSVDYSRLTPVLVEAMKEQQKIIEEQKAEIETQKQQIKKMEAVYTEMIMKSTTAEQKIEKMEATLNFLMKSTIKEEAKK